MGTIREMTPPAITRTAEADLNLKQLASQINAAHEQCEATLASSVDHALTAGRLLLHAKGKIKHGSWLAWLKANVKTTERMAQRYMRLADNWQVIESKSDTVSDLTARGALALLSEPKAEAEDAEGSPSSGANVEPAKAEDPPAGGGQDKTEEVAQAEKPVVSSSSAGAPEEPGEESAEPEPAAAKVPTDAWGIPIQPHAAEAFSPETIAEFKRLVGLLRQVQGSLTALADLPGGKHLQELCQYLKSGSKAPGRWSLANLDNAINDIETACPKVTDCPYAHNPEAPHPDRPKCNLCHGTRWLSSPKGHKIPPTLAAAMKAHYGVTEGD